MPCGKEHKKEMAALPKKDKMVLKKMDKQYDTLSKAGKKMDIKHDQMKMKASGRGR